jgi:hypothetical protein
VEKSVEILWKSCGKLFFPVENFACGKSFPQIFEFSTGNFEKFSTGCGKLLIKLLKRSVF